MKCIRDIVNRAVLCRDFFLRQVVLAPALVPVSDALYQGKNQGSLADSIMKDFSTMFYAPKHKTPRWRIVRKRRLPMDTPRDIPYTKCGKCGTPRRMYFLCETCYEECKVATRQIQEASGLIEEVKEKLKGSIKREQEAVYHNPQSFEEAAKPWIEKYGEERLKPAIKVPREPEYRQNLQSYTNWYLGGGEAVVREVQLEGGVSEELEAGGPTSEGLEADDKLIE